MKSKRMIRTWADGLIFVFLKGCDNTSVGNEFTYVDSTNPNFFHSSAVFRESGVRLRPLIEGIIVRQGIPGMQFRTDKHLHQLAEGACLQIVHRNFSRL
jgi:hypothetical protein